jgi:8-oxo-dGTP pyrophosphatase MutT (NUDIX family)
MAPSSRKIPDYYFKKDQQPRMSSVMIMLYLEVNEWKFPLILRPENTGLHSSQMALPGGRMEKTDLDRIETAIRETNEEIGVDMSHIEILGSLTELHIPASHHTVLPVVGYLPYRPEFKTDPGEVESLHIALISRLLDESNRKVAAIPVSGNIVIEAPYYDVEGKIVWGATAMILSEFLYIIREIIQDPNFGPLDKE